jgi:hypothetical protein
MRHREAVKDCAQLTSSNNADASGMGIGVEVEAMSTPYL